MPGPHGQFGEEGVDAGFALRTDAAAVRLRDGLRDGKPESEAAVACPRGVSTGKAVKDLPQRLRGMRLFRTAEN